MTDEAKYSVGASLPTDDPWRDDVNAVLSRWAELAEAETIEEGGRTKYQLGHGQVWPSDYVVAFLVRSLSLTAILEELDDTALRYFAARPRDLGAFYHRCYDRIRQDEQRRDREELLRLRSALADSEARDPDPGP